MPLFRPKGFMSEERRMAKLQKLKQWHKVEDGMAGAPLIICPSAGSSVSKQMKLVCQKFKKEHKIDVRLYDRGGNKIGNLAKSDPLKRPTCERNSCFPCTIGCFKNNFCQNLNLFNPLSINYGHNKSNVANPRSLSEL